MIPTCLSNAPAYISHSVLYVMAFTVVPAVAFPDLTSFKYCNLFKEMETELSAIKWCQTNGLLTKDNMCACNELMEIRERNSETNKGFYFRCTVRSCKKEISVRKDTFFEGSHLSIATIFQFIYFWCRDSVKQDELQFQLEIGGSDTIVDWKNFCHDICLEYFLRNPGSPGHTVEIDECLLVSRK